ncbi:MAG: hypothetical protein WBB74_01440 [Gaiellaceae bacterium]
MRPVFLLVAAAAAVAVLALPASGADTPVLLASVGSPGSGNAYVISLKDVAGNRVTHLQPGTYQIEVQDYATIHNFDLSGPGVSEATTVEGTGPATWTVTFTNGSYHYQCDAHPTLIKGDFVVGKVLHGQVGPKQTISLRDQTGARVKSLTAGSYPLTVRDSSRTDNFHLTGPGVNKKTGVRSRGTSNWRLSFKTGTYRFRSDAHKRLSGSFSVK